MGLNEKMFKLTKRIIKATMSSVDHHRTPKNIRCILHNQHLLQMKEPYKDTNTSHWVEFTAPQGERGEKGDQW